MKILGFSIKRSKEEQRISELSDLVRARKPDTAWDSDGKQQEIWKVLRPRLGSAVTQLWRADFANHLAEDSASGAEQAYHCLVRKLIDAVDLATGTDPERGQPGHEGSDTASADTSAFSMYRKID